MIYFAVATLHFYRKDIIPLEEGANLGSFAENNKDIIKRVIEESLSLFNYELSHEQIGKAIGAYVASPQSVKDCPVATAA